MDFLKSERIDPLLLLNAIFQTAIDGIIAIDETGIIRLVNPAITALFQYTSEELIGQNISILMTTPHRDRHDGYMNKYYQTGEKKIIGIGRETEGRKKDGTTFALRLSVSEIQLNGQRIFTGIIHDLSERKKAEAQIKELNAKLEQRVEQRTNEINAALEKLMQTNKKLESEVKERKKVEDLLRATEREIRVALEKEKELNELKSQFITMTSHEFRTPLSTILSSAALVEMYQNKNLAEKAVKHLQRIRHSVNDLTSILNDFNALGSLEHDEIQPNYSLFYLRDCCRKVIEQISDQLKPGQQIEFQAAPEMPEAIYSDQSLLELILVNLLSNAIKYSPENSTVYCRSELSGKHLIIKIKDEGIGIPTAEQSHLFTRFFRGSNVTNIKGTGLGLNLAKRYVELLNGEITFHSEIAKGTLFTVQIPKNQYHEENISH